MGWDILLFDLDGTLTDSGPGIMHAAKTALQSFGIDGLSEQELRYFVGPPLWESFGKYLPEEQISAAIDRFREYYRVTGWLENEPYPGVRECLQALQGAGKRMYVATSKLETMARQVLARAGPRVGAGDHAEDDAALVAGAEIAGIRMDRMLPRGRDPLYGKHSKNLMKTDVRETEGSYELDVDLPGFKKDEVNVELNNGYLTIEAAKSLDKDDTDKQGHRWPE